MKHFRERYDPEYCVALYSLYESGDSSVLNELLKNLCSLVGMVSLHRVGKSVAVDRSVLEANALEEVYRVIEGKDVPYYSNRAFTRYLSTVVFRSMMDSIDELQSQAFEFWKVARHPYSDKLIDQSDAERKLYVEQIVKVIHDKVLDSVRFVGRERDACKFIIDCEFGFKDLDPRIAKRKYNLSGPRCNYLIRYVRVLITSVTWKVREDEGKSGSISPQWEASGGILCIIGELG